LNPILKKQLPQTFLISFRLFDRALITWPSRIWTLCLCRYWPRRIRPLCRYTITVCLAFFSDIFYGSIKIFINFTMGFLCVILVYWLFCVVFDSKGSVYDVGSGVLASWPCVTCVCSLGDIGWPFADEFGKFLDVTSPLLKIGFIPFWKFLFMNFLLPNVSSRVSNRKLPTSTSLTWRRRNGLTSMSRRIRSYLWSIGKLFLRRDSRWLPGLISYRGRRLSIYLRWLPISLIQDRGGTDPRTIQILPLRAFNSSELLFRNYNTALIKLPLQNFPAFIMVHWKEGVTLRFIFVFLYFMIGILSLSLLSCIRVKDQVVRLMNWSWRFVV